MIARRQADMLAYADDCLAPSKRAAFEALMRCEPEIGLQIDEWRRQNNAIRAAFAGLGDRPASGRALTADNGRARADWMPQPFKTLLRLNDARAVPFAVRPVSAAQAKRVGTSATGGSRYGVKLLAGLLLSGAAVLASATSAGLIAARADVVAAGVAAYRVYGLGVTTPVEYVTRDTRLLDRWLGSQIARATPLPDFSTLGLTLVGGRIVPGARGPAALMIYEDRDHRRVGLVAESFDAPAPIDPKTGAADGLQFAFWTGSRHAFALINQQGGEDLAELGRLAALN